MKIRTGFVSNSSSSSFVCIGIEVTQKDVIDNLEAIKEQGLSYTTFSWWDGAGPSEPAYVGLIKYDGDGILLPISPLTLRRKLHDAGLVEDQLHARLYAYGGEVDHCNLEDVDEGWWK